MSRQRTCAQGHSWTVPEPADGPLPCPVCGTLSGPTVAWGPPTVKGGGPAAGAAPPLAGFEVLGVLGQGGAGVVYKARQLSLDRVVAVKFLAAGPHAGPDLLARFRTEAEAVARLQHANIVQIHEVGQADGGPFLVLEYVPNGSLAERLRGAPQPARGAAECLLPLARAVHFAHEHGILHRDLKPANVLIAADGTLKVGDFGLAKRLATASLAVGQASPTAEGAILGTPSYMAPEQASGVTQHLGPPADVYGLGAILYELLTGRPPFLAEGPVETVLQVLTEEPVPPRRLQSRVPRDLETICLKCLHKEPKKRYASARELAEDVERYLGGQPVRARPAGPTERLLKWARRRRAVAALLAVVAVALLGGAAGAAWHQHRLTRANAELARVNEELKTALEAEARQKARNDELLDVALDTFDSYGEFVDEQTKGGPELAAVRARLAEGRLRFYEPFQKQAPTGPRMRERQIRALAGAARAYLTMGRLEEAEAKSRQAEELARQLAQELPGSPVYPRLRGSTELAHALILLGRGQHAAAEARFRQALEGLEKGGRGDLRARRDQAQCLYYLADIAAQKGRPGDAERLWRRQLALVRQLPAGPDREADLGMTLAQLGDLALARGRLLASPAPPAQPHLGAAWQQLGRAFAWQAERKKASGLFRAGMAHQRLSCRAPAAPAYRFQALGWQARAFGELAIEFDDVEGQDEAARALEEPAEGDPAGSFRRGVTYLEATRRMIRALEQTPAGQKQAREERAAWAVRTLTKAAHNGYHNVTDMRTNPVFAPLRGRPDFEKLLAAMAKGAL
jgi:tetratricopeptide (TPR) repeat protein